MNTMTNTNNNELNFYDAKAMSEIMEIQRSHVKRAVKEVRQWQSRFQKATSETERHHMNQEGEALKMCVIMHYKNYVSSNKKFFEMYRHILGLCIISKKPSYLERAA